MSRGFRDQIMNALQGRDMSEWVWVGVRVRVRMRSEVKEMDGCVSFGLVKAWGSQGSVG